MRRVTDVLDSYTEPELWEWKLRVGKAKAKKISDEALEIGTKVDEMITLDIGGSRNILEGLRPEVVNAYQAWLAFKLKYPDFIKDIETTQARYEVGDITGKPDIIKLSEINDIKTSNQLSVRPKWVVQASKYAVDNNKTKASILLLSKKEPRFLYIWWDGILLEYFGRTVFDAFNTVMTYNLEVSEMIRSYMESEALGATS